MHPNSELGAAQLDSIPAAQKTCRADAWTLTGLLQKINNIVPYQQSNATLLRR